MYIARSPGSCLTAQPCRSVLKTRSSFPENVLKQAVFPHRLLGAARTERVPPWRRLRYPLNEPAVSLGCPQAESLLGSRSQNGGADVVLRLNAKLFTFRDRPRGAK